MLDEVEREDLSAKRIQRTFRKKVAHRLATYPDRYLPGWGLMSPQEILIVQFIQAVWRKKLFFKHKLERLRNQRELQKQMERLGPRAGKPLKPQQALKMATLAIAPPRMKYSSKPDIASERPMLRSADAIFSDPMLTKHKQWTRTVPGSDRLKQNDNVTKLSASRGAKLTRAGTYHGVKQRNEYESYNSAVGPISPIQLSVHDASQRRAGFSAAVENPTPPQAPIPGRPVSAPLGARKIKPAKRTATTLKKDLSTFGGIQQRDAGFGSTTQPSVHSNLSDQNATQVAAWWLEEKAQARQRLLSARSCDRPAWNTSTSLAR